jgi:hypothetical protein
MPDILKVVQTDEMAGLLRVELVDAGNGASPEETRLNNRILEALIRAEIPIVSFGAEGGRLQDIFLQLTEESVR